MRNYSVG